MQPFSGNQRPDLVTSLMNMSRPLRLPREMHLSRSSSNVLRPLSCPEMLHDPFFFLIYDKVQTPFDLHAKRDLNVQTCSEPIIFFSIVDFEMCFAPQQRTFFQHLSFQKRSENGVCFVHFDFEMTKFVRATTACNFLSLTWPDGSAPAALANLLSTLRNHKPWPWEKTQ